MHKKMVFILLLGIIISGYGGTCREEDTGSSGLIPAVPSNLRFTSQAVRGATVATFPAGTRTVGFEWTDNSNYERGYIIERSTDNVNFIEVGRNTASNGWYDPIDEQVQPLISGVTYYYRVRAYNDNGNSEYSNVISATIQ